MEHPIHHYTSINALFTRGLRQSSRQIDIQTNTLTSPVDGTIIGFGHAEKNTSSHFIKGHNFSLPELIGKKNSTHINRYAYISLYLSPSDCHRIMAPTSGQITQLDYIQGNLFPVREPFISQHSTLYNSNERTVVTIQSNETKLFLVAVAAINVSKIDCTFAPSFITTCQKTPTQTHTYSPPHTTTKGDWIQTFLLGSSVVMIMDPSVTFSQTLKVSQKIKYGELYGTK